jgi:pimeloyl-ACP methyl ester carboxylesterase
MSEWSDDYVVANGIRIHYYRTGGNKPQVVFNHGAWDDGLCWTRVVKELEHEYDIILPDARGHGKSASGKGDYSSSQRAKDLAELIEALKLDRPVVGGHSMGAHTSLHFAADYPALTRGVFLEDPPIFLPGEPAASGEQAARMEAGRKQLRKHIRTVKIMPKFIGIRMAHKASPAYPDIEIVPWVNSKKRVSFDFLNSINMRMDFSHSFDLIAQIQVPIILIIGDRDKNAIVSREAAQEAARINSRLQVVHLEGASHDIRRTRFDGYMPALQQFLIEMYRP